MRALRRERMPFAVLGALLLALQLLFAGLAHGAMAAERIDRAGLFAICHSVEGANRIESGKPAVEPDRDCPCLPCTCTGVQALRAADPVPSARPTVRREASRPPARTAVIPVPKPFERFARAGRGPPATV